MHKNAKAWLETVCTLFSAFSAALRVSWGPLHAFPGYQIPDHHRSACNYPLKAICSSASLLGAQHDKQGALWVAEKPLRATRGERDAYLLHHFAELTSILDACLSPVLSALCCCGSLGVKQACSDEETDKVGLLEAIVASFLVQLHTETVLGQLA